MDLNILIPAICIAVSLLILVGVAVLARRATVRALVWWVGLACLPVGLWLAGLVPHLIDAWNKLAEGWQGIMGNQPLPTMVMAGLIVTGLGLLLMLISRIIPHRRRQKAAAKTAPASGGASATRGRPVYGNGTQSTPTDAAN